MIKALLWIIIALAFEAWLANVALKLAVLRGIGARLAWLTCISVTTDRNRTEMVLVARLAARCGRVKGAWSAEGVLTAGLVGARIAGGADRAVGLAHISEGSIGALYSIVLSCLLCIFASWRDVTFHVTCA